MIPVLPVAATGLLRFGYGACIWGCRTLVRAWQRVRGLVTDPNLWPWSSYAFYQFRAIGLCDPDPEAK
jgi:hypothetical protein